MADDDLRDFEARSFTAPSKTGLSYCSQPGVDPTTTAHAPGALRAPGRGPAGVTG
ncbi:MAG: hypothetical protein ABWZ76_03440 [Acidimicrobiales bacterium]